LDALSTVAEQEYRNPRDQAAKLLVDSLARMGVLADAAPSPDRADRTALEAVT
jgi:hypothetical protein